MLLRPAGTVWVHLGDSEAHRARCVLDKVFGAENFVTTIAWEKDRGRRNDTDMSSAHDHMTFYAKVHGECKRTGRIDRRRGQQGPDVQTETTRALGGVRRRVPRG